MDKYEVLSKKSLELIDLDDNDINFILNDKNAELLPLLNAAYKVRYKYFENKVKIHIINNVKNGNCTENCSYCAQSKDAENDIKIYPMRKKEEIVSDAKCAYENGAYRYCLVFSGSCQNNKDIDYICDVVSTIKKNYNIDVCVSAGFLDEHKADKLKIAGVGRYNHNLNTSSIHYKNICSSHDYAERIKTLEIAKSKNLDICSGVIIGLGETVDDLTLIIKDLKRLKVKSVPINFFIPVKGHRIKKLNPLNPSYCLRVLCLFRFALPDAEIRIAGGREYHLRSMQSLSLFPVNSLFAEGYLTSGGNSIDETKKMINDAGFIIDSIEY